MFDNTQRDGPLQKKNRPCHLIVGPGHGATKPEVVAKVIVVFCCCQHW